ncbi:MAG: tRNA guanosine(34) transglycosylase Tgt [bacterium]
MEFRIEVVDGKARAGACRLGAGEFRTPAFMPVGTRGVVKAMTAEEIDRMGFGLVLCNAYHLYLRPGVEVVEAAGGLRKFMGWGGLILTDSGGYQIFSLKGMTRIEETGVEFRSHLDGSAHFFTPESCVELQARLGADIMMALDVCPPYGAPAQEIERAAALTGRWASRCRKVDLPEGRALFGIVQGGVYPEMRERSAHELTALDFPGYAVGGVSVGEPRELTREMTELTAGFLPADRPRYVMGVGTPPDVLHAVGSGCDMFDCVLPTRMARNGAVFTARGRVALRNAKHAKSEAPLDPECGCEVCERYSRAYVRHLFMSNEITAARLATFHNLCFYAKMMNLARDAIVEGRFESLRRDFVAKYEEGES